MVQIDTKKRIITEKEARDWASNRGFGYCETSCLSGEGVTEAFQLLIGKTLETIFDSE
jgi:hypothetical protein